MKRITILLLVSLVQSCETLSPYETAQQEISTMYVDAKGNYKIGYWAATDSVSGKESAEHGLMGCVSSLTLENLGAEIKTEIASVQLIHCMRSKGWELKFEPLIL